MANTNMKAADLRSKSEQEMKELIQKIKRELEDIVSNVLKGKEKNVKKINRLKREVARIKTLLGEKEFLKGGGNTND